MVLHSRLSIKKSSSTVKVKAVSIYLELEGKSPAFISCSSFSTALVQMQYSISMSNARVVVTLWLGILLDLRMFGVASLLGPLLLLPVMQICGKRVLWVMQWIYGDLAGMEQCSKQIWWYSRQGGILPMLLLEWSETGKLNNLCSSWVHVWMVLSQELRPKVWVSYWYSLSTPPYCQKW